MKKQVLYTVLATAVLSTVLASCGLGGSDSPGASQTQRSAMSYSEKASYYDALVAGDSDPIPLTTSLNNSIFIEGDSNLLEEDLYNKIVEIANQAFPLIRSKYGVNGMQTVTITLDASSAGYAPCYAVGNTVMLNTEWLNNHPKDCDILIDGLALAVLQYGKKDTMPPWLMDAMKVYIRDEFGLYKAESSFALPKRYNGKSYENDSNSAAAFLKWIRTAKNVDIVDRLNRQIRSVDGYVEVVWKNATGETLEQLWSEYKNA